MSEKYQVDIKDGTVRAIITVLGGVTVCQFIPLKVQAVPEKKRRRSTDD